MRHPHIQVRFGLIHHLARSGGGVIRFSQHTVCFIDIRKFCVPGKLAAPQLRVMESTDRAGDKVSIWSFVVFIPAGFRLFRFLL